MDYHSKDPDRAILESRNGGRVLDPLRTLTEAELDDLLSYFGELENNKASDLRPAIDGLFRHFMGMAKRERFREREGRLEKVPKPSTIIARQMKAVGKACEDLDRTLAKLDPTTRSWLDQNFKKIGVKDESDNRVRLRNLEKCMFWQIDLLISAARDAEELASRGPNNTSLRYLIEGLANLWETSCGRRPTSDKARGLRADPFLNLCQEMAEIGHFRLKAKGGGLGALQLSGLVAEVLKERSARTADRPPEK